jgi:hypothetical protein
MTQQYLVGELSAILGELQSAAPDAATVREVVRLRREVEATPPAALDPAVGRARALANRVCGDALSARAANAFIRDVQICAELDDFGVSAGFLAGG